MENQKQTAISEIILTLYLLLVLTDNFFEWKQIFIWFFLGIVLGGYYKSQINDAIAGEFSLILAVMFILNFSFTVLFSENYMMGTNEDLGIELRIVAVIYGSFIQAVYIFFGVVGYSFGKVFNQKET